MRRVIKYPTNIRRMKSLLPSSSNTRITYWAPSYFYEEMILNIIKMESIAKMKLMVLKQSTSRKIELMPQK